MATWLSSHDLPRDAPAADACVRKLALAGVEAIDDTRRLRFRISDGSVDRDNDTINPHGWQLEAYKANPVVLWAHDARALPIAKTTGIGVENGALVAEAEFATHPFAQTVYDLLRGGFLRATSVGFRALDYVLNAERRGVDFQRQELLEFSVVPVPANANALVSAAASGVDLEPLRGWLQATIADWPGELRLKGAVWDKLRGVSDDEADPAPVVKRGRVLSAANEQRLRDALNAISDVLNTLPQEPASEPPAASETAAVAEAQPAPDRPPVPSVDALAAMPAISDVALDLADEDDACCLDLADDPPAEDTLDLDLSDLRDALGVVVRDAVRDLAHGAVVRTLNQLRGRVD